MINSKMLCRSAVAYSVINIDSDRNAVYDENGQTLTKIYINNYTGESDTTRGKDPDSAGVLYYDVQNSRPLGFVFKKGMKLLIDNENYTVYKIAPFYNAAGLQHYEVSFK